LSRNKRFYQFLTYNSLNVITFTVSSEANVHTCTHVACNGSKKQPSTQNPWYTSFFSSNDEHYQDTQVKLIILHWWRFTDQCDYISCLLGSFFSGCLQKVFD